MTSLSDVLRGFVVTVFNAKGGVSKTTTTVNLAWALRAMGYRVAVINLDPQRNLLQFTAALQGMEVHDASQEWPDSATFAAQLRGANGLATRHHFVLIDCPPSMRPNDEGFKAIVAALTVCDLALSPVQPAKLAMDGLAAMQQMVRDVRRRSNAELLWRVLITMHDARNPNHDLVAEAIRTKLPNVVFGSAIKHSMHFDGAAIEGRAIDDYSPRSRGGPAYRNIAQTIVELQQAA